MDPAANIVSWTLSTIHNDPDKPVLIDVQNPQRFITKKRAARLVARLAGSFVKGSTVCLHLFNDITYPILTMAINASGCCWTGTNPAYTAHELEHHFRVSNTKYVITTEKQLDIVREATAKSGLDLEIILFADLLEENTSSKKAQQDTENIASPRSLHHLLGNGDEHSLHAALKDLQAGSIAALFSTSGTTGRPKMAARTHQSLVLETQAIEDNNDNKSYEVRRLYSTPIFHAFSTPEMMYNALRLGQESYFMQRFDLKMWPQAVKKYQITEAFAPPAVITMLANSKAVHSQIRSLRAVFTGGAPLSPGSADRLRAACNDSLRIVPVWGMTEGGWFTTLKYPEDGRDGSVGRAIPGYEIKVSDQHQYTLDDGTTIGEIYVRGPSLMKYYLGNEKESDNAFEQGWLKTGDIGHVRDGKVFLLDRAKDMIKVKGWQVMPTEIENWLATAHQEVQDCGVVGSGYGEEEHPVVFVVRKSSDVTEDAIKSYLREGLTAYKVRDCKIKFVDSIPRSAPGKILRKELRASVDLEISDRFSS